MALGELSFAFDTSRGETPETVKRKRMLAEAILGQASRAPKDVGEGLNAIGQALLYRKMMSDAGKGETAGASAASKIFQSLMGSNFPAPPPAATTASAPDARADMSGGADSPSPAQQASYAPNGNEIRDGILSTAQALGIDPIDLGTAISYETAGTFDPMQKGPRTQWGQHKGLIQFGEPQAKQYGVDWSNPVGSQLGPDGAVAKYLRDTGVKPGMGMLDIYSAINAGGVGLYNRSDADNGGAPGTVRDKVEKQMAGHRAKALALLGDLSAPSPAPQGAVAAINAFAPVGDAASPQQVASLDPSIGMPAAAPEQPQQMAGLFMGTPQDLIASRTTDISPPPGASAKQRIASLLMSPQSMTGGAPMPIQGTAPAEVAPQQQVAQAMTGDAGPWGASLSQADAATRAGPSMEQLMQAASDPWVAQKYGGIIEALLQQKLKASDPLTQLQIEKAKRELAAPPERKTTVVNGRLVDAQTGQEIASFPDAQDPFTLSPGEIRFGPDGKQIAAGGDKPPTLPSAVQEYEYAKGQGFPGTFADWEASKKGGMSLQVDPATGQVTFQQGANIKPLTEGQSKDTVFTTKAEGSLPIIDKFGDALTSLGESVGGNVPVLGNYMKSPEYQQAEQAGQEFLMAILRKETGAAITDGEMKLYGDLYLPRPGDAPEKLLQKKASRARAVEAIKAGMPPQAILYVEKALAKEREAKGINPAVPPATETPPPPPTTGGVLQNGLKWSIEP